MSLCIGFSALHSSPTVKIWRSWREMFSARTFATALKEAINFRLLWKNCRFVVFTVSNVLLSFVYFLPLIVVTDRIKKWKLGDDSDAARLMCFFGVGNGLGRLLFGWLATYCPANQLWLYILSTFLMGVFIMLTNIATNIATMHGLHVAIGLFYGKSNE